MIAAIYACKSTDQNGVPDEEHAVAWQIEHATACPTPRGVWEAARRRAGVRARQGA